MVHRLERLGIWLGASVGGVGLLYAAMTAPPDTAAVVLGILYVLGFALVAVGALGFASEVVVAVHGRLPGTDARAVQKRLPPLPPVPKAHVDAPAPVLPLAEPQERVFVPPTVTPQYLTEFFDGRTDAQGKQSTAGYVGKWMALQGSVTNVQVFETSAVVSYYLDPETTGKLLRIYVPMWFSKGWIERVSLLAPDDHIEVVGRIAAIGRWDIELRDCELTG